MSIYEQKKHWREKYSGLRNENEKIKEFVKKARENGKSFLNNKKIISELISQTDNLKNRKSKRIAIYNSCSEYDQT